MTVRTASRPQPMRRRNTLTATAICLLAGTVVFFKNQEGIQWFMWRDAPLLAVALVVLALVCAGLAHRAPRG
jgi:peptidoglycan/LPS O-acetylase OafA/YrhL